MHTGLPIDRLLRMLTILTSIRAWFLPKPSSHLAVNKVAEQQTDLVQHPPSQGVDPEFLPVLRLQ